MNKCSFHKSLHNKAKAEHKHNSPVKIIKLSLWFVLLFYIVFSFSACGVNNPNNEMVETPEIFYLHLRCRYSIII